jgi:hypothetical protein
VGLRADLGVVFILNLFYDSVSSLERLMNKELEGMWKEAALI